MTELLRLPRQSAGASLSLCIASLGSAEALSRIQSALTLLRPEPGWELVLVINGGNAPVLEPEHWRSLGWALRILHQAQPGKSRALNRAMAEAAGELLVFTDDDVVPDPGWLKQLVEATARYPGTEIFGGRILPLGEVPEWIRRSSNLQQALLSEHDYGEQDRPYPLGHYPIGPNMAVRRAAVSRRAARWNEALGPGTALPVGDESGFLAQLSPPEATDRLYVAAARVYHTVDGRYFPLPRALRRAFQIGLAAGRLSVHQPMTPEVASRVARGLPSRVAERLCGLRSGRELACVLARAGGVLVGSKLSRRY